MNCHQKLFKIVHVPVNSYHAILSSTFLFSFFLFQLFSLNSLNTLLWSPLYIHPLLFYLPSLSLLTTLRELLFIFRQLCYCLIYSKISILYEIINQDVSHLSIIDSLGKNVRKKITIFSSTIDLKNIITTESSSRTCAFVLSMPSLASHQKGD